MRIVKRKKHAKKRPKAKKKNPISNSDNNKIDLRAAISHALSSGWVQNSGITCLGSGCVLIAAIMTSTQVKAAALAFALTGTAFLWLATLFVIGYKPDNPFDATIIGIWSGQTRDSTQIYAQYNNFITHVPVLLNVRVVNLQQVPATISKLGVEIEVKKRPWIFPSKWVRGVDIPDAMPLVWVNPPPEEPMGMELIGERLDAIFRKRPLQPHETVSGWILLDFPAEYDDAPHPFVFRISLKDTAKQGAEIIDSGPIGKDINVTSSYGLNFTTPVNLEGYRITHWADNPTPWRGKP